MAFRNTPNLSLRWKGKRFGCWSMPSMISMSRSKTMSGPLLSHRDSSPRMWAWVVWGRKEGLLGPSTSLRPRRSSKKSKSRSGRRSTCRRKGKGRKKGTDSSDILYFCHTDETISKVWVVLLNFFKFWLPTHSYLNLLLFFLQLL